MSRNHPVHRAKRGTTLIEAVAAILVLGIAIPPLIGLFSEVAAHSVDDTFQGVAVSYADALMEEIVSKSFEDPDLSSGSFGAEEGSRASYDDIDDYDGLSNSPPKRFNGTLLDDYGGFTRSVIVDNVTAAAPDPGTAASDGTTDFKRIRVKVEWNGGKGGEVTLSSMRTLLSGSGGSGGSGVIDVAASIATVLPNAKKKEFLIDIVSLASSSLELSTFALSDDAGVGDKLNRMDFYGPSARFYQKGPGTPLPTGVLSSNAGTAADRTIAAGASPTLTVHFKKTPSGTIVYTLVLNFTDGSASTLVFTVNW